VLSRLAELGGAPVRVPSGIAYAMFDGLFQQALSKHLAGDRKAVAALQSNVCLVVGQFVGAVSAPTKPTPVRRAARLAA
jgi:hypothetical protein